MTCPLPTCFSVAFALPLAAAAVTGQFDLSGGKATPTTRGGVVVWLEPVGNRAPLPPASQHTILQKNKRFSPHISVVPVGTTVDLPNLDPIFHNAFSNFAGQPFDTGLYPPGGTQKIRFQREGVVRVFCNIHSRMSAVVVVVGSPWFAVSGDDGHFSVDGVPPGEYTVKVWHERATEAVLKSLERRVTVPPSGLALPAMVVNESGYVALPHPNKYGGDYAPEPPSRVPYGKGR